MTQIAVAALHGVRAGTTRLPWSAWLAIAGLCIVVPFSFYVQAAVHSWQVGGSPAAELTDPYFWAVGLGRCAGAIGLAVLLMTWRRPACVTLAIATVWLAGPPVDLLLRGIDLLAASGGKFSWQAIRPDGLLTSMAFPVLVTLALLAPRSARAAYGLAVSPATIR